MFIEGGEEEKKQINEFYFIANARPNMSYIDTTWLYVDVNTPKQMFSKFEV